MWGGGTVFKPGDTDLLFPQFRILDLVSIGIKPDTGMPNLPESWQGGLPKSAGQGSVST